MRVLAFVVALSVALAAQTTYVPDRVFDTAHREFTDFEMMLADVAKADVVFVGEQHDDPNTHRLELALLEGVARRRDGDRRRSRDVRARRAGAARSFPDGPSRRGRVPQGRTPWPNYKTDYKPLVDFAMGKHWPVVASNVPRAMASEVSKAGFDALKTKSAEEAKWFAKDRQCPVDDSYFKRFSEAMSEHPTDAKAGLGRGRRGEGAAEASSGTTRRSA